MLLHLVFERQVDQDSLMKVIVKDVGLTTAWEIPNLFNLVNPLTSPLHQSRRLLKSQPLHRHHHQ